MVVHNVGGIGLNIIKLVFVLMANMMITSLNNANSVYFSVCNVIIWINA